MSSIKKIYKADHDIFTRKDLALIWSQEKDENLNSKIQYYVNKGDLKRLTRGVFSKSDDYDVKELAGNIYRPSYISFETVLKEKGVIFQHYESIFLASPWSFEREIDGHKIVFRKLKDEILFDSSGIRDGGNYSIATKERAFLDMIYLFPDYYFDNLDSIDWDFCFDLIQIYNNKELKKRLKKYYQKHAG